LPIETAHILRRAAAAGEISSEIASLAHVDLVALPIKLFPYGPFATRVWDLRANVTTYDAWYVALAESLGATLATLDTKLTRAAGPSCPFVTLSVQEQAQR
jgi:predicted nucleic acid-binding protein